MRRKRILIPQGRRRPDRQRQRTPLRTLGKREHRSPPTTESTAKAWSRRFSSSHKTGGGALSSFQPITTLPSSARGGDIRAGGRGGHALAFWFTTITTLGRDRRGGRFLRLTEEEELLRFVDSGLFLFLNLENKPNPSSGIKTVAGYLKINICKNKTRLFSKHGGYLLVDREAKG